MAKQFFVPELQLLYWSDERGPRNLKWRMLKRKLSVYYQLCFYTVFSLCFPNILNIHICSSPYVSTAKFGTIPSLYYALPKN